MVADFILVFDNACKYNEPDSLIYKVRHGGRLYSHVYNACKYNEPDFLIYKVRHGGRLYSHV